MVASGQMGHDEQVMTNHSVFFFKLMLGLELKALYILYILKHVLYH
jgi:hypothetical protein